MGAGGAGLSCPGSSVVAERRLISEEHNGVLRGMFILPCFLMGDGRLPGFDGVRDSNGHDEVGLRVLMSEIGRLASPRETPRDLYHGWSTRVIWVGSRNRSIPPSAIAKRQPPASATDGRQIVAAY